ncbi:acyltransferase [Bradyrhizobium sp. ISRA442]|uniref:acyltransferase family protein n=1 Tax=Bradyrhizobium sp. ISRA442 TaxID=2866197 RepID=UPI00311AC383
MARGLAALSIAYFHSWVGLLNFPKDTAHLIYLLAQYGWIAVDVFFAISGFVICVTISRSSFSSGQFLIRRFFRLYPLWWLAAGTFVYMSYLWSSRAIDWGHVFYCATLLPTEEFPILDVGWSLQHEMMFYLAAAIIAPWFGLYGIAVALAASTIAFHTIQMPWYFSHLAMYHSEFLAGILAFLARPKLKTIGPLIPLVIGVAGLAFFIGYWGGRTYFPIALFFLILGFSNLADERSVPMKSGVLLGDASYSIYLWHPLMFKLAYVATGRIALPIWCEEIVRFGTLAVIVTFSVLSFRFFEKPINRFAGKLRMPLPLRKHKLTRQEREPAFPFPHPRLAVARINFEAIVTTSAKCSVCGEPRGDEPTCAKCGSSARTFSQESCIGVKTRVSARMRQRRLGAGRWLVDMIVGHEPRRAKGGVLMGWVEKFWRMDRPADLYQERVVTEDGQVLRDVEEPLSAHFGHGSDRPDLKEERERTRRGKG